MKFPLLLLLVLSLAGCNIINPAEPLPTTLLIDSFRFDGKPYLFGDTSHKITNVWVYLDDKPVGAYQLPAKVPLLAKATSKLVLAPGIDVNGLRGFEATYPFYVLDNSTIQAVPGKQVSYTPVTRYQPGTKLWLNINFDNGNDFLNYGSDTSIVRTADPAYTFNGSPTGLIRLENGNAISENLSIPFFKPNTGESNFIELNYKGTLTFQVGVLAVSENGDISSSYIGGVNPSASWNKIYFGISDFINGVPAAKYYLLIRSTLEDNPGGSGYVALDNIKVVGF